MNLPTLNAVLKDQEDKAGLRPIIIDVTFQRKRVPVTTGFKTSLTNFDKHTLIGKEDPNHSYKNRAIRNQMSELERRFIRYVEDYGPLDIDTVRSLARGEKAVAGKKLSDVLTSVKKIYSGHLSDATLITWQKAVNNVEAFRPAVLVSQLTETFLMSYEAGRKKDKAVNTVWSDFKVLNSVLNKAVKHRILTQNPLAGYSRPKYRDNVKVFLTDSEVALIEDYADNGENKAYRNVAAWFVFACRSGLRYQDLQRWDPDKHITGNRLYFSDQKEENPHFIPIRPDLQRAIDRVEGSRIPSNQKCNDYIKEVAKAMKINKTLTMHTARHTFAVDFLDKGGDIKVLQLLMGHKKLSTTEVYGKITDKRIEAEVKRVYGY